MSETVIEYSVEVENLSKTYVLGKGGSIKVNAVEDVSFKIKRGEFMLLMGPSGSGKTTLFNMIGGLDRPTSGSVYIDEVDISKLDAYELAWLRSRKIGYIFQTFNLIPVLTAFENVELPMIFAGVDREEREKKVKDLLERVGLGERMNHKPNELSGGQQQRVAIARALANDPTIILADEPTGNLDLNTGLEIINLLKQFNREKGVTIMTATHDLKLLDVADRILWLRDGKIERIEERAEVAVESSTEQGEVKRGMSKQVM
ncbi:ABC transporter ATP-binding protein [Tardisphaera saccharovorans]